MIKGCDSKLVEAIVNEVVPKGATGVRFSDISGQEKVRMAPNRKELNQLWPKKAFICYSHSYCYCCQPPVNKKGNIDVLT